MSETKELIEFLDEQIKSYNYSLKDHPGTWQKGCIANLTEIKQRLENEQANDFVEELVEVLPAQPDELIEEIVDVARRHITIEHGQYVITRGIRKELRTILQGNRGTVRVGKSWIAQLFLDVSSGNMSGEEFYNKCKGFEVIDK